MAASWSDSRILSFIEMYRSRPVLWDIRLNDHKDRTKRRAALLELAEHFGVTREEVERKIKNLLSHYSRELKKVELGMTRTDYWYRSKWFCFNSMQFLNDRHKPDHGQPDPGPKFHGPDFQTVKAEEAGSDPEIVSLSEGADCDPLAELAQSPRQSVEMYLSPEQTFAFSMPDDRRGNTSSMSEDDTLALLREISSLRQEKDEFTLFGEQVAVKLRKLTSPYARIMAQHIINTTLFEAEMGKYNDPAPMASTLPTFPQPRKDCPATSTSHNEPKRRRQE